MKITLSLRFDVSCVCTYVPIQLWSVKTVNKAPPVVRNKVWPQGIIHKLQLPHFLKKRNTQIWRKMTAVFSVRKIIVPVLGDLHWLICNFPINSHGWYAHAYTHTYIVYVHTLVPHLTIYSSYLFFHNLNLDQSGGLKVKSTKPVSFKTQIIQLNLTYSPKSDFLST